MSERDDNSRGRRRRRSSLPRRRTDHAPHVRTFEIEEDDDSPRSKKDDSPRSRSRDRRKRKKKERESHRNIDDRPSDKKNRKKNHTDRDRMAEDGKNASRDLNAQQVASSSSAPQEVPTQGLTPIVVFEAMKTLQKQTQDKMSEDFSKMQKEMKKQMTIESNRIRVLHKHDLDTLNRRHDQEIKSLRNGFKIRFSNLENRILNLEERFRPKTLQEVNEIRNRALSQSTSLQKKPTALMTTGKLPSQSPFDISEVQVLEKNKVKYGSVVDTKDIQGGNIGSGVQSKSRNKSKEVEKQRHPVSVSEPVGGSSSSVRVVPPATTISSVVVSSMSEPIAPLSSIGAAPVTSSIITLPVQVSSTVPPMVVQNSSIDGTIKPIEEEKQNKSRSRGDRMSSELTKNNLTSIHPNDHRSIIEENIEEKKNDGGNNEGASQMNSGDIPHDTSLKLEKGLSTDMLKKDKKEDELPQPISGMNMNPDTKDTKTINEPNSQSVASMKTKSLMEQMKQKLARQRSLNALRSTTSVARNASSSSEQGHLLTSSDVVATTSSGDVIAFSDIVATSSTAPDVMMSSDVIDENDKEKKQHQTHKNTEHGVRVSSTERFASVVVPSLEKTTSNNISTSLKHDQNDEEQLQNTTSIANNKNDVLSHLDLSSSSIIRGPMKSVLDASEQQKTNSVPVTILATSSSFVPTAGNIPGGPMAPTPSMMLVPSVSACTTNKNESHLALISSTSTAIVIPSIDQIDKTDVQKIEIPVESKEREVAQIKSPSKLIQDEENKRGAGINKEKSPARSIPSIDENDLKEEPSKLTPNVNNSNIVHQSQERKRAETLDTVESSSSSSSSSSSLSSVSSNDENENMAEVDFPSAQEKELDDVKKVIKKNDKMSSKSRVKDQDHRLKNFEKVPSSISPIDIKKDDEQPQPQTSAISKNLSRKRSRKSTSEDVIDLTKIISKAEQKIEPEKQQSASASHDVIATSDEFNKKSSPKPEKKNPINKLLAKSFAIAEISDDERDNPPSKKPKIDEPSKRSKFIDEPSTSDKINMSLGAIVDFKRSPNMESRDQHDLPYCPPVVDEFKKISDRGGKGIKSDYKLDWCKDYKYGYCRLRTEECPGAHSRKEMRCWDYPRCQGVNKKGKPCNYLHTDPPEWYLLGLSGPSAIFPPNGGGKSSSVTKNNLVKKNSNIGLSSKKTPDRDDEKNDKKIVDQIRKKTPGRTEILPQKKEIKSEKKIAPVEQFLKKSTQEKGLDIELEQYMDSHSDKNLKNSEDSLKKKIVLDEKKKIVDEKTNGSFGKYVQQEKNSLKETRDVKTITKDIRSIKTEIPVIPMNKIPTEAGGSSLLYDKFSSSIKNIDIPTPDQSSQIQQKDRQWSARSADIEKKIQEERKKRAEIYKNKLEEEKKKKKEEDEKKEKENDQFKIFFEEQKKRLDAEFTTKQKEKDLSHAILPAIKGETINVIDEIDHFIMVNGVKKEETPPPMPSEINKANGVQLVSGAIDVAPKETDVEKKSNSVVVNKSNPNIKDNKDHNSAKDNKEKEMIPPVTEQSSKVINGKTIQNDNKLKTSFDMEILREKLQKMGQTTENDNKSKPPLIYRSMEFLKAKLQEQKLERGLSSEGLNPLAKAFIPQREHPLSSLSKKEGNKDIPIDTMNSSDLFLPDNMNTRTSTDKGTKGVEQGSVSPISKGAKNINSKGMNKKILVKSSSSSSMLSVSAINSVHSVPSVSNVKALVPEKLQVNVNINSVKQSANVNNPINTKKGGAQEQSYSSSSSSSILNKKQKSEEQKKQTDSIKGQGKGARNIVDKKKGKGGIDLLINKFEQGSSKSSKKNNQNLQNKKEQTTTSSTTNNNKKNLISSTNIINGNKKNIAGTTTNNTTVIKSSSSNKKEQVMKQAMKKKENAKKEEENIKKQKDQGKKEQKQLGGRNIRALRLERERMKEEEEEKDERNFNKKNQSKRESWKEELNLLNQQDFVLENNNEEEDEKKSSEASSLVQKENTLKRPSQEIKSVSLKRRPPLQIRTREEVEDEQQRSSIEGNNSSTSNNKAILLKKRNESGLSLIHGKEHQQENLNRQISGTSSSGGDVILKKKNNTNGVSSSSPQSSPGAVNTTMKTMIKKRR